MSVAWPPPTILHITHWKAGSQWVNKILHQLVFERVVTCTKDPQHLLSELLIQPGKIYPALYFTKEQFDGLDVPAHHRRFVVIRDLRDTLVSVYFSTKVSHAILSDQMADMRRSLQTNETETGMLYLLQNWLPHCAAIQESWLRAGEPLLRYEDLLENDLAIFERVLLEHCALGVSHERLREAVLGNRFESLTHGRPRGVEDVAAHERKGIRGDWRNHFTPHLKDAFKARFGDLLIATGYETSCDW